MHVSSHTLKVSLCFLKLLDSVVNVRTANTAHYWRHMAVEFRMFVMAMVCYDDSRPNAFYAHNDLQVVQSVST